MTAVEVDSLYGTLWATPQQAGHVAPVSIQDWFDHLYGTAVDGWLSVNSQGGVVTDWARVGDTAAAAAAAAAREPASCVWFGVATRRARLAGSARGGQGDCLAIPGMWLDVDIEGIGHAGDKLATDLDHAHRIVGAFPLPPTVVVNTGGGLQAWWLFNEMVDLDDHTRDLLAAWKATWTRLGDEHDVALDNVWDIPRMMRLPGTTNRKEGLARPVTIVDANWTRRFGTDDLEQHLDGPVPAPRAARTSPTAPTSDRPGDLWAAATPWEQILEPDGWTLHHVADGVSYWTRPGKDRREGSSASVGYKGSDVIKVFTSSVPGLEQDATYSKFGYYAATQHGCNFTDARRALAAEGWAAAPDPDRDPRSLTRDTTASAAATPPPDATTDTQPNLPVDWWNERPELARIRQAAHERTVSADAVLGAVLARVAVLTPPTVKLPAVIGTAGTLDLAVALVAPSGAGKSSAMRVSADLVPITRPGVADVRLGSGEGLIEAYFAMVEEVDAKGKTVRVKRQVHTGVLASLDEGQALAEMGNRKGATLLPTIRSAWTGDALGQANATEERRRLLPAGEYRFALVAGFQTDLADALVNDAAGGTPQRFLFLSATDDTIPDDSPGWPIATLWKPLQRACQLDIDPVIAGEVRARHLARVRGEVVPDPLDAHRDLSRLKVAGLLALLANRTDITVADWRLAGDVLDVSDRVRAGIIAAARWRAREAERTHVARLTGRAAALDDDAGQRAVIGMAKAIARHVQRHGCSGGCVRRCVTQTTKSSHRKLATIDEALTEAAGHGWIVVDGDAIRPGKATP